jgi:chaperonin GroEL
VVFAPAVSSGVRGGIQQLAAAILPTLGPSARPVAIARDDGKPPDLLDDGAAIARRILSLGNRTEDVGAMLLRHALWRVHQEVGDGTATACAMFVAAYHECARQVAAGIDAVLLRDALQHASPQVLAALDAQATCRTGIDTLTAFAQSICHQPEIARCLAAAFHTHGPHVRIEIRDDGSDVPALRDIPGSWWKTTLHAERLLTNPAAFRSDLERVAVLATDLQIDDPGLVRATIAKARETGAEGLLVFSNRMTDPCVAALLASRSNGGLPSIAVRTPFASPAEQMVWLDDIELLTGGKALRMAGGMGVAMVGRDTFGFARQAWCDLQYAGIVSGRTCPVPLAGRIRQVREAFECEPESGKRQALSERIAVLTGAAVRLSVSPARRELAERTTRAMRAACRDGFVPGGGIACLRARASVDAGGTASSRAASQVLVAALEAPFLHMARNQGVEPVMALSRVDAAAVAVLDSAATIKTAWQTAIEGAAQAITIGAIVHRAAPEAVVHP